MSLSEHDEQALLVEDIRRLWPGLKFFAIPNGGHRHPATAARLKAEGVDTGVPDLCIPVLRLWIELKKTGGKLSPQQAEWIDHLNSIGDLALCIEGRHAALTAIHRRMKQLLRQSQQR